MIGAIIMGLLIGAITGFVMKSSYPWYIDLILGLIGSVVGGWISGVFFGVDLTTGFNLTTLLFGVLGAVVVVAIARLATGRRVA
jgi:uncharacterized membrane protein YeaQ/YmgE (transglycosylase-associated protein family)